MNYINPHEFYLETDGKIIDVDGCYGGQCWDLFAYFCQKYCGRTFSCIKTGYVCDFWYNFDECGLSPYFDKITDFHALQDGDWIIWDKNASSYCWITSKSHIAMFRKYNDDNPEQNIILTQNPNGNPNCTHQMVCDFHGFIGALRPKVNTDIPQANITKFETTNITKDSVEVVFEATGELDYAKYSINNLEYKDLPLTNTIDNLKENTKYTISITVRTKGTDLWTESNKIEFTTLGEEPIIENSDSENSTETPQISTNEEESPIIQENNETLENEPKVEEIETNLLEDETIQDNTLIKVIKFIIEIVQKIFKKS